MVDRLSFAVGAAASAAPTQPVTAFSAATLKLSLLSGPTMTCAVPGRSPAGLVVNELTSDVWVYRLGVLWRRLRVLPMSTGWTADGDESLGLACVGYRQLVEGRHVISGPPTFSAVDQGTIVWNLIQHTQAQTNGDLGITAGSITTGVVRDRTDYKVGDNLGKLLGDLSRVENGPWWDIDAAKELSVQLFSDFAARTNPIVLGANARNVQRKPGSVGFANVAGAVGSATATVPHWAETAGLALDSRGRWETFDASHSSVTLQPTVVEIADGVLADRANPPYAWTVEIEPAWYFERGSNYDVGEFVPVVVPRRGLTAVQATIQVTEITFSWDDSGAITVMLSGVEV